MVRTYGDGGAQHSTWLLPVWTESHGDCGDTTRDAAMLLASDDGGASWAVRGRMQRDNVTWLIENTLSVADARGTLLQLFRTRVRSPCSRPAGRVRRLVWCQYVPFSWVCLCLRGNRRSASTRHGRQTPDARGPFPPPPHYPTQVRLQARA